MSARFAQTATPADSSRDHVAVAVPTVDLRDQSVANLRDAITDVGFFYLTNFGMRPEFLSKVMEQSKKPFDLPLEQKLLIRDKAMVRGYTPMEEESLSKATDPSNQNPDTKEGFYIGRHHPVGSPMHDPRRFRGPNVWPVAEICDWTREECEEFRSVMETYFDGAHAIAMELIRRLALVLELPESFFDPHFTDQWASIRLLHYEAARSEPAEGRFACGAHSDYGMITLLLTDDCPGLQIFLKGKGDDQSNPDDWLDVPPRPDCYVVNLGDSFERWTNGRFKSTIHRVLTAGDRHRYSIPYFVEANYDTVIECLECCVSEENSPKYGPITQGEHLTNMYKQTHVDYDPGGSGEDGPGR